MKPILIADDLPLDQRESISRLKQEIHDWFRTHPDRASAVHGIALFGSRAIGLCDPELSDWDLYLIREDDAPHGPLPSDDIHMFEECPTEWHRSTLSDYRNTLKASSLSLSRAVEKFGIPIYGSIPETTDGNGAKKNINTMHIDQLTDSLLGIATIGATLPNEISAYLLHKAREFPSRTREGEPYVPELFKHSSNFAEHVCKLIVLFRGLTPYTIHNLDLLADQLQKEDPYRDRIAALNGATREGNISLYATPSPPPDKAQDEPVHRSKTRIADTMRLLRDFLSENGSAIQTKHVPNESAVLLKMRIDHWEIMVETRLNEILHENPSERWIEPIWQDSRLISSSLNELLRRIPS